MPRTSAQLLLRWTRFLLAGFVGYLVIALLTTLVLEVALGGANVLEAGAAVLAFATVGGIASGIAGGFVAGFFRRREALAHSAWVLLFLGIDTTYITINEVGDGPAWFKILSGLTLMASTLLGGWLAGRSAGRRS